MIIRVNLDWRVVSDPLQWTVQRRRVVKGQVKWEPLTFHKSLDNACLSLARRQLRDLDTNYRCDDLIGFCRAVDSLKSEILAALENEKLRPPKEQGS